MRTLLLLDDMSFKFMPRQLCPPLKEVPLPIGQRPLQRVLALGGSGKTSPTAGNRTPDFSVIQSELSRLVG
jgi:hypothetical protein